MEATICAVRTNIADTTGAFVDALALPNGPLVLRGPAATSRTPLSSSPWPWPVTYSPATRPKGSPLANEALTLARQVGDPALIASGVLAVGTTVVETDPDGARACQRESLELSTALGYQGTDELVWAAAITLFVNDWTATLELGRSAILALQRGGNRLLMGITLHIIAGALAAIEPEAAAVILGAAQAHVIESADCTTDHLYRGGSARRRAHTETTSTRPPTWTGTEPSPTPLPKAPKHLMSSNPGLSHEQVAPGRTRPGSPPFGSRESSCRRSSAPIGFSLAALDCRLGHITFRLLLCSSADSATATRRRGRTDRHRQ